MPAAELLPPTPPRSLSLPPTSPRSSTADADDPARPASDVRRWQRGAQAVFIVFYLVDGLLLTAYGLVGTVSMQVGWMYALAGLLVSVPTAVAMLVAPPRWRDGNVVPASQTVLACGLMLITAGLVPQVGMPLLMTAITVVASSALKIGGRSVLLCWAAIAVGSASVVALAAAPLALPAASTAERAISAVWFVWILGKGAAVTLIGATLRTRLARTNTRLQQALRRVEEVAAHDDLTALPNRRAIRAALDFLLQARAAPAGSIAVALLDVDHFKAVNDRFGHGRGDEVLRSFADVVGASLRPFDQVGRYGGEEFLLILTRIPDAAAAHDAAERVRRAVERHDWNARTPGLAVTVSIGVALLRRGDSVDALVGRADTALYGAKGGGRNRVVVG